MLGYVAFGTFWIFRHGFVHFFNKYGEYMILYSPNEEQ